MNWTILQVSKYHTIILCANDKQNPMYENLVTFLQDFRSITVDNFGRIWICFPGEWIERCGVTVLVAPDKPRIF